MAPAASGEAPAPTVQTIAVRMLQDPVLREFWDFATSVRRTQSLAARASTRLRGAWLTSDLAIQRVHGWSSGAVRLLCVPAATEERRSRLKMFFSRDKRNMEGHLVGAGDALDNEPRVLIKVPFNQSLADRVEHERMVLTELQGLEGVPALAEHQLYFEDLGLHSVAYHFSAAPTLMEQLERGGRLQVEGLHKVLSFSLATLARVHDRGWLHNDLQPKDVLLVQDQPEVAGGTRRPGSPSAMRRPLLCGWGRARRREPEGAGAQLVASGGLLELLTQVGSGALLVPPPSADQPEGGGPCAYSAPEQLADLYLGLPCSSAATDVYRAAAVALTAVRTFGPLGKPGHGVEPALVDHVDALRRLCHEALLRRAEEPDSVEGEVPEPRPPAVAPAGDELEEFSANLAEVLGSPVDLRNCGGPELEPFFRRCLAREPSGRPQTAAEALEALDEAWGALEEKLLAARHRETVVQAPPGDPLSPPVQRPPTKPRARIVLEPPPELEQMAVL